MSEKFTPKDALTQAQNDVDGIKAAEQVAKNFEGLAETSRQSVEQSEDRATRAQELFADPEWQDRINADGHTVETFRAEFEDTANLHRRSEQRELKRAGFERSYAGTLADKAADHYNANQPAYYHAAVAEANMQGVHINTGGEQLHASNVRPTQES